MVNTKDLLIQKNLYNHLMSNPTDKDAWGVYADFIEESSDDVFVVMEVGVYRHRIIGVFKRVDIAIREAEKAIGYEKDHHHDMQVIRMTINDSSSELGDGKGHTKDKSSNEKIVVDISMCKYRESNKVVGRMYYKFTNEEGRVICENS